MGYSEVPSPLNYLFLILGHSIPLLSTLTISSVLIHNVTIHILMLEEIDEVLAFSLSSAFLPRA